MARSALALAALTLAAVQAGAWGSLITSYNSPALLPYGLGYLPGPTPYLTVVTDYPPATIWRVVAADGSVVASYAAPSANATGCDAGVISGVNNTWVMGETTRWYVFRLASDTGSVYGSFEAPRDDSAGLAFRDAGGGYYLYATHRYAYLGPMLCCLDALTGSVYASYSLRFGNPFGCAYDGAAYLYIADLFDDCVYMTTLQGSTLASFPLPAGVQPSGVAYGGGYVYVSTYYPTPHRIYVYETGGSALQPVSLGRVKAVFR